MKIASHYKKQGCDVELLLTYDEIENYDRVFVSKVFTDTAIPEGIINLPWVEHGGTGFFYDNAPPLPNEIEHAMPDYSLYDNFVNGLLENGVKRSELTYYLDHSIGFATRGCIRGCSFCVNKNYRQCLPHSPVEEFLDPDRRYICLLDDNILSCKDWRIIFEQLNSTGKRFQFKQGLDERLLTDEKCEVLFNSNWYGEYIFAFDNINDRRLIERKLQLMRKHTDKIPKFYVFCAYNHKQPDTYTDDFWGQDIADVFERIKILMLHRSLPYIMRYKDYDKSPYRGMYITLARWCNQPSFLKKMSFRQFAEANGLNSSAFRYASTFEKDFPEIASAYYDMKWK